MAVALILSVGTTAEPLKKAIDEVAQKENVRVYLLYGRPFPQQSPNPFEVAHEVFRYACDKGVAVLLREVAEPEDFDQALQTARQVLEEVKDYKCVVVNYTGGTKAMSAALVHAALTSFLSGELELHYVGGVVRDKEGKVLREAMEIRRQARTLTEERVRQVLDALRQCRFEIAANLAEYLPDTGKPGFLKQVAKAFLKWDGFDYEGARHELQQRQLPGQVRALTGDEMVGDLAQTVQRLIESAQQLAEAVKKLRKFMQPPKEGVRENPPSLDDFALLCADVLENAERCCKRYQFNEAVLRAYRALEVAVQGALLNLGLNPWRPNWTQVEPAVQQTLEQKLGRLPEELALWNGWLTWQVLSRQEVTEEQEKRRQDLQNTRNRSILEHGYVACDAKDAERCIKFAQELSEKVLSKDLNPFRERVKLV